MRRTTFPMPCSVNDTEQSPCQLGDLPPVRRMGGRVYVVTARLRALLEQDPTDLGEAA
ncbi:hypothetical protein OHB26_18760 [Nocardia sp. NBC_01503]|uniref:hypothetical protein n=1 Tax=Nocardia sp. NBC_01503 TaxID=2975997 RepID=UPI002E7BCA71|nr:hypothetical protein [Nocardia sp. NBC_01503]WTL29070.1 hypothetical protein OHB26_18760 [Nocardia sp. NBC_01503]